MNRLLLASAILALASSQTLGADLPAKAPAPSSFGSYPYVGSGFYKGLTSFAEIMDSQVASGAISAPLFQAGAAAGFTVGYVFGNSTGTTFTALEANCAYHNTGGSQLATQASLSSKYSCSQLVKFGGSIANVVNWLPSGLAFPSLPNLGVSVGPSHPYIGFGATERQNKGEVVGASHTRWDINPFLHAGFLTQFSTNIVGDIRVEWQPNGSNFSIIGPVDAKTGQAFRVVGSLFF